ncbi:hypothetical protein EV421DRAFT_1507649 [Armillaria borealis]|uniref:Secreted protein n=1 Tax=Armillaria borealis TaxID=47425 RepID=A0AA39IYN4_9AGAR|nr:hypothetical protein EV421DRAFT_1507649 [Armillaria borealis]
MLRRFTWILLIRLFSDPCLVGGRTTVELFDGDNRYICVFLYAFKLSNMSGRNHRIIFAQISSIIFNTWTIHFSRTSTDPYSLRFTSLTGPRLSPILSGNFPKPCVPTFTYGEDAPRRDWYYTGYYQYLTDASHQRTEPVMRSSLRASMSRAL